MTLQCPSCGTQHQPEEVLDAGTHTWPHEWQDFHCKSCAHVGLFVVSNGLIQLGMPDGFPGPVFMPESEAIAVVLSFHRNDDNALTVRFKNREWFFPSKVLKNG